MSPAGRPDAGRAARGQRCAARARERRGQVAHVAEVPLLDRLGPLARGPAADDHDPACRPADRGHPREDVRAGGTGRVERRVIRSRRRRVAVDAVEDQLWSADPGDRERRSRALRSAALDLQRGRLELAPLGRRHAQQGQDVLERGSR